MRFWFEFKFQTFDKRINTTGVPVEYTFKALNTKQKLLDYSGKPVSLNKLNIRINGNFELD